MGKNIMQVKVQIPSVVKTIVHDSFLKKLPEKIAPENISFMKERPSKVEEKHVEFKLTPELQHSIRNKSKALAMKVVAADEFMGSLNLAHNRIEKLEHKHNDHFQLVLNDGLRLFKEALEKNDNNLLFRAAQKFSEANEQKKSNPEPYFFMAYIFSLAGDNMTALKYYQIVREINPHHDNLEELKEQILATA